MVRPRNCSAIISVNGPNWPQDGLDVHPTCSDGLEVHPTFSKPHLFLAISFACAESTLAETIHFH